MFIKLRCNTEKARYLTSNVQYLLEQFMKKRKKIHQFVYYINPILTRIKAVYMLNELYIYPFQLRRNGCEYQKSTFIHKHKKQKTTINSSLPAEES